MNHEKRTMPVLAKGLRSDNNCCGLSGFWAVNELQKGLASGVLWPGWLVKSAKH